jgi:hypothetical protein
MGSILLRGFTRNILIEKLSMNNVFTRMVFFDNKPATRLANDTIVYINWSKLYPFNAGSTKTESRLSRLQQRIIAVERVIESYTRDTLVNRLMFVEWGIRYEKAIGWNFLNGDVVDIGNGYLSELAEKNAATANADALTELYEFLQGLNVKFLYVQAPHKIAPDDPIRGTRDFSNENADDLLRTLSLRRIPYLDLRENITKEGLDHHALFYKTDHHWKVETGLWVSGILMNYLNSNYGFSFDPRLCSHQEYHHTLYKDWFLGSLGKKVTLAQTQAEDFTLIYPKFNTDVSLTIPEIGLDARGNFDIFIDHPQVDIKDYYNLNPYGAYMYGDRQVISIHNYLARDGKKILLIKDSFANVVSPFLSAGIADIHILDLRHFNGSARSYIEKNKPDIVIVLYNPPALGNKGMFDFQ